MCAWGTPWFSPCCGESGKQLLDAAALLSALGTAAIHSRVCEFKIQLIHPHVSLTFPCSTAPKAQPSSTSYCILPPVSIWLLHPVQHQYGWSKMSYLGWESCPSAAQIEDQMQTFTLGSCHLKYTRVELISKENENCLIFYSHVLHMSVFVYWEWGYSGFYLGLIQEDWVARSLLLHQTQSPCSCRQSCLTMPLINW